jgi:pilus assembly protein CpaE
MSAAALQRNDASLGERDELIAFVGDDETRQTIQSITERHWPRAVLVNGGAATAVRHAGEISQAKMLVLDLADSEDPVAHVRLIRDNCTRDTHIIAIGAVNDVNLYRELISLGVTDYLVKPLTSEAFHKALISATTEVEEEAAAPKSAKSELGRLVLVIGARGGVGTTAVTVNIGSLLAREYRRRTVILDLDLKFGTTALSLDLDPGRGLAEALTNPARVDGLFIASAVVPQDDRLFLLAAEEALDGPAAVSGAALTLLLNELRQNFDCVIADLPRWMAATEPSVLAGATDIVVVSDLSLPGMRDTLRLNTFLKNTVGLTPKVIVNRVPKAGKGTLSPADFAKGIEAPTAAVLPEDAKVGLAAASGKPYVETAGKSRLVQSLRPIAEAVSGTTKMVKAPSFLQKLLSGKKKAQDV